MSKGRERLAEERWTETGPKRERVERDKGRNKREEREKHTWRWRERGRRYTYRI